MTAKEKWTYEKWNREMTKQGEATSVYFKAMQDLYAERGGGRPTCSLERNLEYLLTSGDERTRGRALALYKMYWEASGRYDALLQLGQAFADIQ